jgi:alpha,alpha-trehalase
VLCACLLARVAGAAVRGSPQDRFGELFTAVQTSGVFADSKTFADAVPRFSPRLILHRFHAQRPHTPPALRAFVARNFILPEPLVGADPPHAATAGVPIGAHIDQLWAALTRNTMTVPPFSSALPVPRPYVVPGGRFRELYYWDSYFTMLGLAQSGRQDLVQDMIRDFAALIDRYGHVPNGTRSYYLGRSQPPFFFEMVALLNRLLKKQVLEG